MAKWQKLHPSQEEGMRQWLASRSKVIQDMVAKYNLRVDTLYRLKVNGQNVILHAVYENGTVAAHAISKFNPHIKEAAALGKMWDRTITNIDPADLVECDLPEGVEIEDNSQEVDLKSDEMKKVIVS